MHLPGGRDKSGGQREFVPVLARVMVAVGISGSVHGKPIPSGKAFSDGPNSWPLDRMASLLATLVALDQAVKAAGFEVESERQGLAILLRRKS